MHSLGTPQVLIRRREQPPPPTTEEPTPPDDLPLWPAPDPARPSGLPFTCRAPLWPTSAAVRQHPSDCCMTPAGEGPPPTKSDEHTLRSATAHGPFSSRGRQSEQETRSDTSNGVLCKASSCTGSGPRLFRGTLLCLKAPSQESPTQHRQPTNGVFIETGAKQMRCSDRFESASFLAVSRSTSQAHHFHVRTHRPPDMYDQVSINVPTCLAYMLTHSLMQRAFENECRRCVQQTLQNVLRLRCLHTQTHQMLGARNSSRRAWLGDDPEPPPSAALAS